MFNIRTCFKVKVAYKYRLTEKHKIIVQTEIYNIVTDFKDLAMDEAIYINKQLNGSLPYYQYMGCAVINEEQVYIK